MEEAEARIYYMNYTYYIFDPLPTPKQINKAHPMQINFHPTDPAYILVLLMESLYSSNHPVAL